MFKLLGNFIQDNTSDPFKSVAHFFRSGATFSIMMNVFTVIFYPIAHMLGYATNFSIYDSLVIILVSAAVLLISKLFIKE